MLFDGINGNKTFFSAIILYELPFTKQIQYIFPGSQVKRIPNYCFIPEKLENLLRHERAHGPSAFHQLLKELYKFLWVMCFQRYPSAPAQIQSNILLSSSNTGYAWRLLFRKMFFQYSLRLPPPIPGISISMMTRSGYRAFTLILHLVAMGKDATTSNPASFTQQHFKATGVSGCYLRIW